MSSNLRPQIRKGTGRLRGSSQSCATRWIPSAMILPTARPFFKDPTFSSALCNRIRRKLLILDVSFRTLAAAAAAANARQQGIILNFSGDDNHDSIASFGAAILANDYARWCVLGISASYRARLILRCRDSCLSAVLRNTYTCQSSFINWHPPTVQPSCHQIQQSATLSWKFSAARQRLEQEAAQRGQERAANMAETMFNPYR
jgi:hypothetical protein